MDPPLDNARHLRYFQRCLRTLLPHQYTSNDSTRMTLGCFIIAAIDLLSGPTSSSATKSIITQADRRLLREWVLACQHPAGGFAGSPTHVLPRYEYDGYDFETHQAGAGAPGTANIAATYFALQLLALLAEDGEGECAFTGVDRAATLKWLRRLQREDGSFGEVLFELPASANDSAGTGRIASVEGGRDMRYCYLAAMIRWVLRGDVRKGERGWVEDIDVEALSNHIKRGQTYDGGFGESSMHESHAGYAYCAIAALSLLDRPPESSATPHASTILRHGITNHASLIQWLASRQFVYLRPDDGDDDDDDDDDDEDGDGDPALLPNPPSLASLSLDENMTHIGFNGRCNKVADTCYCWWVAGTLDILGQADQLLVAPSRRFMLDKTQHLIGGFSKHPGGPPDLYHAYLGLAALATMGEPGLKSFDSALCISTDTVRKIEAGRRALLKGAQEEGIATEKKLLDMGLEMLGRKVNWLSGDC